ncbi:MAG: DNA-directed RNA polymerase subunit beta [Anaerolineae bacterium]|nr:DNA-directed RNA polymerase subunit beta [Anaerolineae bacterium]
MALDTRVIDSQLRPVVDGQTRRPRKSYSRLREIHPLPDLIEIQAVSYKWFQTEGLRELFEEISPIVSFNKALELHFVDYRFDEPKHSQKEAREMDMTYAAPLWVQVRLTNRETGEIQEQEVFMGDFPLMTDKGTFIINGTERVVVSQLIRSPGVYFTVEEDRATGRQLCNAKLIPNRGAWLEFETSKRDVVSVKVDRKRKFPVTQLLRAIGMGAEEEILTAFRDVDTDADHPFIEATLERDTTQTPEEALLDFYKKLRPGDPPTLDNARNFLTNLLFQPRRYDLNKVGRYKLNRRLNLEGTIDLKTTTLTKEDLVQVVKHMIRVNNGEERADDIDHLGNRRVKTVGELLQNQLRIGLLRMERVVRERMSTREPDGVSPLALINIRPVVAATREFFGGSQLSQFNDQTNPLAELTHKRTLSALGPGGLRRERAGFDVRDVHHSHYGRICPIETPEGPNIGLIGRLASFGRVNEYGFIETPYRRVVREVNNRVEETLNRAPRQDVRDPITSEMIVEKGQRITQELAQRLAQTSIEKIPVVPYASDEIVYMTADEEDRYTIANASAPINEFNEFIRPRASVRRNQQPTQETVERVDFYDVSPKQIVGVSAALIPFLEHDDANRALMGSNMQRQGVPLIWPEAPIIGTGMEYKAAVDSGQVVVAEEDGEVISVTSAEVTVRGASGVKVYPLRKYNRSNQSMCIDQRPIVTRGQLVSKDQVIADSSSTEEGELALGQNVLVAFLSWEGGNYEDAILVSEEVVRQDKFTSIHIEKHEIEARDTKLGPEEITRDIPNVGEDALKDLDAEGIIRIGAEVGPGDILVGKITPKGETDLTPEEKLLRAIFGEKAREVKDSSLRLPHGEKGKVVDVKAFTREESADLPAGVDRLVRVSVAQQRKVTEGDKMAGRHGNKGVISKVVPIEDMPYLEDGSPVEIILNPLGVPGRMNIGQILETHLGWAAHRLGFRVVTSVFDGAKENEIAAELARAWLLDDAWRVLTQRAWAWANEQQIAGDDLQDDQGVRLEYMVAHYDVDWETLNTDLVQTKRIALAYWLREQGYNPDDILVWEDDGRSTAAREAADARARDLCYRIWMKKWDYDTSANKQFEAVDSIAEDKIELEAERFSREVRRPLPTSGKAVLYDGKTGEAFDAPVTIGVIYMMKLAHLVEDKVHARSTGPYSLVTQQPLGGKAQFGGQRFGEMEVWALEAYGAAHTLQEMLTIKSDDVTGRVKTYEAIVKGEEINEPGAPESFLVLVKELQSLGLTVEALDEGGNRIPLGKEDYDERMPKLGSLGLGAMGRSGGRKQAPIKESGDDDE